MKMLASGKVITENSVILLLSHFLLLMQGRPLFSQCTVWRAVLGGVNCILQTHCVVNSITDHPDPLGMKDLLPELLGKLQQTVLGCQQLMRTQQVHSRSYALSSVSPIQWLIVKGL